MMARARSRLSGKALKDKTFILTTRMIIANSSIARRKEFPRK